MSRRRGQRAGTAGLGAELLSSGWLTPRAAADALNISVDELKQRARDGEIRSRGVGAGIRLYQVTR